MTAMDALMSSPSVDHERRPNRAWHRTAHHGELPPNHGRTPAADARHFYCRAGFDPARRRATELISPDKLSAQQQRDCDLAEASAPIMAQARELLSESGTMMILANADGLILDTAGDPAALEAASDSQPMTGANCNDPSCDINANGTSVSTRGPVKIQVSEHACVGIKRWTSSATVLRDPSDGEILGALDVSTLNGAFNVHVLALVASAAQRIETAMAGREIQRRERLLDYALGRVSEPGSGGLILFDRNGFLVKADARAGRTLSEIGVHLSHKPCLCIEALATYAPQGAHTATLPDWLRLEWLEPVLEGSERLGTAVVLPERLQRSSAPGGLPGYKLRRVREFIDAHMDQPIRLEQLAAAAAVSAYHFHRQFKKATGVTPRQYVVQMRVERAQLLLSRTELPLVEVAAQVGFPDQSHFSETFRKLTSMTPQGFRNATSI